MSRVTNGACSVFGFSHFLTEAGFQAFQRAAALIFTTSSHFFSLCQQHCESVSHSYAATDGAIPLLQPSCWHDSWGSVSWFRVSFIFLLAHSGEAFLYNTPKAMTLVCLGGERRREKKKKRETLERKKERALLGKTGFDTLCVHTFTIHFAHMCWFGLCAGKGKWVKVLVGHKIRIKRTMKSV